MDIQRINTVLAKAIVGLQDGEIESMAEAMAQGRTSYNVKPPSGATKPREVKPSKKNEPSATSQTVGGNVIGPFWYMEFSDGSIYFRPVQWLKSGNVRGFLVRVDEGRRGARKAVWKSVNKSNRRDWNVVKGAMRLPPAVQKRFNEKTKEIEEKDLDEQF